uniref:Uncharacterized protein n=1 Tax=Fagus sylvatica TaxID=28930 RepID=A0A2N9ENT3_FAGSY
MEWDEDESESRVVGHDSGSARQGAPSYLLAEESVTQDRNGSSKNTKNPCDNLELWCLMFILDTPPQAQRNGQDVELGLKKGKPR